MKGLGANRSRHLSDSCEPSSGPQRPLYPMTSDPHGAFLLSPTMNHYGTLDPHLHHYPPPGPSLPPDCLLSLNQLSNSSTFPRLHFTAQPEQVDYTQGCMASGRAVGAGGSRAGPLSTSMSMGMGLGLGLSGAPMITSGSATISAATAANMNRLPSNLLDQLERHLPLHRDGFSTLQFHRGRVAKQRSESPGRIRHLVHSVQKLFAKSQSLESSAVKGSVNGRSAGGGGGNTMGGGEDGTRQTRRSKSKDRAKTEGQKQRPRPNALGLWSSDDALDSDSTKAGTVAVGYRNPLSMMTLGRAVSDSQASPRHIPQGYNTISAHTLKSSKSSSDLKYLACPAALAGPQGGEGGGREAMLVKRGSWSTLTLSQARQVFQKGSATVNRTLLKSKSCHQDLTCQYLQVPLGDWSGTLGRGRPGGTEIPCRRMRSGSYVKAMGDLEDSEEDSEGSPKPSPKSAARRQSYLKATQLSLSEQQPPPPPRKPRGYALMQEEFGLLWPPLQSACSMQQLHSCLPSLRELSTNRSLDNLDCLVSPVEPPMRHWDNDFNQGYATLGRGMNIGQVCGQGCGRSMPYCEGESQAVEALDLPMATCFRSRSHSYLRAIQAGCSQDEDSASVDSDSPPPTTAGCIYASSTISTCVGSIKRAPPPVPPRTTSKPFISVTVQSSTESAQDTYLDGQDRRSEANSQSGRSNSSDSLCSTHTGSLAKGSKPPAPAPVPTPTAAPVPAPRDPPPPSISISISSSCLPLQPQNDTLSLGHIPEQTQTEPKRKLSSIGIQVDCHSIEPITREDPPPQTKTQSIGVQVENGRPLSRASSMASRQNTETESQESPAAMPSENNTPNCNNNSTPADPAGAPNGEDSTVARQPPRHTPVPARASTSLPESLDPALDPSSLPPPDPSLECGNGSSHGDQAQPGTPACLRDGNWFLKLLQAETGRMEGWCQQMELETKDKEITEEVMGTIRSAVGSAQLLIASKFQQFRGLCDENLDVNANPRPTAQDLAGFWDLLQLSIEDISMKFDELWQLKSNNWQLPEKQEKKEERKQPPASVPKKSSKPKLTPGKDRSVDSAVDKQRQEARKRLIAAKRAASVRQNSATESADSIEIYVPEAQTRL